MVGEEEKKEEGDQKFTAPAGIDVRKRNLLPRSRMLPIRGPTKWHVFVHDTRNLLATHSQRANIRPYCDRRAGEC